MEVTDVTAAERTWQGVLWDVYNCCETSRASPNLLSVYCLFPQTYLLGIIISICGNVLISVSLNIQVRGAGIQSCIRLSAHSGHFAPVKTQFYTPRVFARLLFSSWCLFIYFCSLFIKLNVFIRTCRPTDCVICLPTHSQQVSCSRKRL